MNKQGGSGGWEAFRVEHSFARSTNTRRGRVVVVVCGWWWLRHWGFNGRASVKVLAVLGVRVVVGVAVRQLTDAPREAEAVFGLAMREAENH